MEISITHKDISLSESVLRNIDHSVGRLRRYLPNIPKDLSILRLNVKKIKNFFEGSLGLNLPRENLNIHFRAKSLGGAINFGFERLLKRLIKYKGKHFVDNSEYPKKGTVRGDVFG